MVRITQYMVSNGGNFLDEDAIEIGISDLGAGEFVTIKTQDAEITISPGEWAEVKEAIDKLMDNIKEMEEMP